MTFGAYIETIKAKTGLGPKDFVRLAAARGFGPTTKAGDIIAWLAADYGLGRGHAMAIVNVLKAASEGRGSDDERIERLFSGPKANWRGLCDRVIAELETLGPVALAPTDSYLSLLRGRTKVAILQPAGAHLDIGIKRKGTEPTPRFPAAGSWNTMVTHRVRITGPEGIDDELKAWLRAAYEAAS